MASFPYFSGTGYACVLSVNRRNNEARAMHISIKIWKTRRKITVDIYGHFLRCTRTQITHGMLLSCCSRQTKSKSISVSSSFLLVSTSA